VSRLFIKTAPPSRTRTGAFTPWRNGAWLSEAVAAACGHNGWTNARGSGPPEAGSSLTRSTAGRLAHSDQRRLGAASRGRRSLVHGQRLAQRFHPIQAVSPAVAAAPLGWKTSGAGITGRVNPRMTATCWWIGASPAACRWLPAVGTWSTRCCRLAGAAALAPGFQGPAPRPVHRLGRLHLRAAWSCWRAGSATRALAQCPAAQERIRHLAASFIAPDQGPGC